MRRITLILLISLLISASAVLAAEPSASNKQPLKLSPFPNGLQYQPEPEPSNTGNPLLSNTRHAPRKPKSGKLPLGVGGAANNYGAGGAVKAPIGSF